MNDILFYTDNLTEPKRIVLDRFLNTDGSYDVHSNVQRHSLWRSTIEESDQENFVWLEEKYITTIRKNPRLAPTVVAKASDRPAGANIGNTSLSYSDATFSSIAITDGGFNSTFNFLLPNQSAVVESGQEYDVSAVLKTVNWRVGDVLVLTGNLSAATARVKIVAADTSQSTTVGNFTISLLDIDEGYFVAGEVVPPQETWQAVLSSNKKIHNTSFCLLCV